MTLFDPAIPVVRVRLAFMKICTGNCTWRNILVVPINHTYRYVILFLRISSCKIIWNLLGCILSCVHRFSKIMAVVHLAFCSAGMGSVGSPNRSLFYFWLILFLRIVVNFGLLHFADKHKIRRKILRVRFDLKFAWLSTGTSAKLNGWFWSRINKLGCSKSVCLVRHLRIQHQSFKLLAKLVFLRKSVVKGVISC